MSNYKKRSQSLMDEISDNLRRTIKKYNEIDMETDLSIIHSVEEESKSYPKDFQESLKFEKEKSYEKNSNNNNLINSTKKVIELKSASPDVNTSNNKTYNFNYESSPKMNYNYKPNLPSSKANKILENLDDFSISINKDFREVEDMIENMVENELKNFYK